MTDMHGADLRSDACHEDWGDVSDHAGDWQAPPDAAIVRLDPARRGRQRAVDDRLPVTLLLAPEVVARFRAEGGDWRGRMAAALARETS